MKKSRTKNPSIATETKSEKFSRIATLRTKKVIKAIQVMYPLGASSYESTPEQREKMISLMRDAVDELETRLNKVPEKTTVADFTI